MDRAPKGVDRLSRLFRKRLRKGAASSANRQPSACQAPETACFFRPTQPTGGCGLSAEKETVTRRTSPCRTLPVTGFQVMPWAGHNKSFNRWDLCRTNRKAIIG